LVLCSRAIENRGEIICILSQKKRRAITLIEVLTTLTIVSFLFVISVPAYNNSRRLQELKLTQTQVADIINAAKQYSINQDTTKLNIKGYCFQFNKGPAANWKIGEYQKESNNNYVTCNGAKTVESGNLPSYVSLTCTECAASFPIINNTQEINNEGLPNIADSINFQIQHNKTGTMKTISLNKNGVIDEE